MAKERKPTTEEIALFRNTLRDIVQINNEKANLVESGQGMSDIMKISVTPIQKSHRIPVSLENQSVPFSSPQYHAGYKQKESLNIDDVAGVDRKTTEKFRKGRLPIEAVLDLHGMRQHEAEPALNGFLQRCQLRGFRCVMVVTGKGKRSTHADGGDYMAGRYGILRQALPNWLNQTGNRERVLAVHTAQRHHGGSGAFYLLLKRLKVKGKRT